MSVTDTDDDAASEAARQLVRRRWGAQKVVAAAETVISRVSELPPSVRSQVHEATAEADDG
jgi:hypothetical protein